MKLVAYLSGCPAGPKNAHKHKILWDFVRGVNAVGDQGIIHQTSEIIDSDVGFIQGWVHHSSGTSPHLKVRKAVVDNQK